MDVIYEKDVKTKSDLIKYIRTINDLSNSEMAFFLGRTLRYFNNKLSRNSFSIEDLSTVCYCCDLKLIIESNNDGRVIFDLTNVFANKEVKEKINKEKFREYLELKSKIEDLEEKYPYLKETPQ